MRITASIKAPLQHIICNHEKRSLKNEKKKSSIMDVSLTPSFPMVPVWYLAEAINFLPGILLVGTGAKNNVYLGWFFCEKTQVENWQHGRTVKVRPWRNVKYVRSVKFCSRFSSQTPYYTSKRNRISTPNERVWCTTQLAKLSFNHAIDRTHSWRFSFFLLRRTQFVSPNPENV